MPRNRELERLSARKAELIARSASYRRQLVADFARLRPAVLTVETVAGLVRRIGTFSRLGLAVAGMWAPPARSGRWWRKLRAVWQLLTI